MAYKYYNSIKFDTIQMCTLLCSGVDATGCEATAEGVAAAGAARPGVVAGGALPVAAASASSTVTNLGRSRRPSLGHCKSCSACLQALEQYIGIGEI